MVFGVRLPRMAKGLGRVEGLPPKLTWAFWEGLAEGGRGASVLEFLQSPKFLF